MKRHRLSDARVSSRDCLGRTCGTNIDTEGIEFTNKQPNLTYIDKVFSFNEDTACPILFNLNTGGANADDFQVKLFLDGCSIIPCTLSSDAVFEIDNTFVVVEYFNTRPPGNINASQVTLDGFPVDSVSYSNGQYTAKTANVLPKVQKDRCLDRGLPTKAFFLINNVGPWDFRATYVLEGTVTTNGRCCRFRAEITNAPDSMNTSLPPGCPSSFAIRNLSLPCAINGIAPDINFQFNAKINLVNPRLVVNCGGYQPKVPCEAMECTETVEEYGFHPPFSPCHPCQPCLPCVPCIPCGPPVSPGAASCTVSLVSALAIEPVVHVEAVRKTLFCLDACEGLQPCQGSITTAEIEDDNDCFIGGVDGPDCRCGSDDSVESIRNTLRGRQWREDAADCGNDRRVSCCGDDFEECGHTAGGICGCQDDFAGCSNIRDKNPVLDIVGCGNRNIGGVTVGTGTCEDCVWGRTTGHDCIPRNLRSGGIGGACGCNEAGGARERGRKCEGRNDDVMGASERLRKPRTAFQFHGSNGCSW